MKVLVSGDSGIIQLAAIRAMLEHGHILADTTEGCDAILKVVEPSSDSIPDDTRLRQLLDDAKRAGVRRVVLVTGLGALHGKAKRDGVQRHTELVLKEWDGDWTILRAAPVYGPGDQTVSILLRAIRTLPVMPVLDERPFQPVWLDDVAEAIARAVERTDLGHRTLHLAGADTVTLQDLVAELAALSGKSPTLLPFPAELAELGAEAAAKFGVKLPAGVGLLAALSEHAAIPEGASNALVGELGVKPMPLKEGLRRLVDEIPERVPEEGTGPLWRGRYWADIEACGCTPEQLFDTVCDEFRELLPAGAPNARGRGLVDGAIITVPLPLRGDVQLRVEEVRPPTVTCVTLEGQPFAGAMRLLVERRGEAVRFEVQTYERAANAAELMALAAGGAAFKRMVWQELVDRVVDRSDGHSARGVETSEEPLPPGQAREIEAWIAELVAMRSRLPQRHHRVDPGRAPRRKQASR